MSLPMAFQSSYVVKKKCRHVFANAPYDKLLSPAETSHKAI